VHKATYKAVNLPFPKGTFLKYGVPKDRSSQKLWM